METMANKKESQKPCHLVTSAIWFAATALGSVVALDLFIVPLAPGAPHDILHRLHFSKDIYVASTSLLFGGVVGALLWRIAICNGHRILRTGARVGVAAGIIILFVNPFFWVVSLASYLLYPMFCITIFGISGTIFGVVSRRNEAHPN